MIIIDTNVLLSFLLTDGITRRIIAENHDVFMSPEHCFEELWADRLKGWRYLHRNITFPTDCFIYYE